MIWDFFCNGDICPVWQLPAVLLIAIGVLYFVPLLRSTIGLVRFSGEWVHVVNRPFGKLEVIISPVRNTFGNICMAGLSAWYLSSFVRDTNFDDYALIISAIIPIFLIACSFIHRKIRRKDYLSLMTLNSAFPDMDPHVFFDYIFSIRGVLSTHLPKTPSRLVPKQVIDYSRSMKKNKLPFSTKINGLWSTACIANLLQCACVYFDKKSVRNIAANLSIIWCHRIMHLIAGKITIECMCDENAFKQNMPKIFVFTHKSFFDFILAPFIALHIQKKSQYQGADDISVPLFLLAANHFKRNPIYNYVLGIGRMAERLGMIFVERDDSASATRAKRVIDASVEKLMAGNDISIFPQGTRAKPFFDLSGNRLDAGYYSTGSKRRMKTDGGYLKKGAAYIAVEGVLMASTKECLDNIMIVPVAMNGTANACPRGTSQVHMNRNIYVRVNQPIVVTQKDLYNAIGKSSDPQFEEKKRNFVMAVHKRIDASLRDASKINGELERRLLEHARHICDAFQMDELALAMKQWRGDDTLVHATLDAIFACKPEKWRIYVGELIYQLLHFGSRDAILAIRQRIVDHIPKV